MVARAATPERLESRRLDPFLVILLRVILIAAASMLLLVAIWLIARRATGYLQQPLSGSVLFSVGLVLAGLVALLRQGLLSTGWRPSRLKSTAMLLWVLPSLALLLLAWSLSITGTSSTALALFWGTLSVTEGIWWRIARHGPLRGTTRPPTDRSTGAAAPPDGGADSAPHGPTDVPEETADDPGEHLPRDVSQQLTRSHSQEEGDTVAGMLRARFQSGERSQSLHVAFCPPMMHRPRVSFVQITGPRTRIKAADVQPYGVRFELRLATSSPRKQDVVIHFDAACLNPDSAGLQRDSVASNMNNPN